MSKGKFDEISVDGVVYRVIPNAPRYAVSLAGKIINVNSKKVQEDCLSTKGVRTTLLVSETGRWFVVVVLDIILQMWRDEVGPLFDFLAEMQANIGKSRAKDYIDAVYAEIRKKKREGMTKGALSQLFDVHENNIYRVMEVENRKKPEKFECVGGNSVKFTDIVDEEQHV